MAEEKGSSTSVGVTDKKDDDTAPAIKITEPTENNEETKPKVEVEEKSDEVPAAPNWELSNDEYTQEIQHMQEIHRTFSTVINDFENNSLVEKFMDEYKKLYEALKESHVMQRKYMMECSNLRCEIKNNAEKVNLAIHLSQEDKEIINNLTKQVNQAWNEVDTLSDRESRANSVIEKLRDEIQSLTSVVEAGSGVQELYSVAEQAVNERKELEKALMVLREELEFRDIKINELSERIQLKEENFQSEVNKYKEKIDISEKKKTELQRKLDDLDNQIKFLEHIRTNLNAENATAVTDLENCKTKVSKLEKEEADLKADITKYVMMYNEQQEALSDKTKENIKLSGDLDLFRKRLDVVQTTNSLQKGKLDDKERAVMINENLLRKKETEIESLTKKSNMTNMSLRAIQKQLTEREGELRIEKDTISNLLSNLKDSQLSIKKVNMTLKTLQRMSHKEQQNSLKLTNQKVSLEKSLGLKNKANMSMTMELNGVSKQLKRALETMATLESDKERLYGRINQILEMVNTLARDNDNKEAKLMMLLKVNNELEFQIHNTNSRLIRMTNKRDSINNELHLIQLKNDELNVANVNFHKQSASLAEDLHNEEKSLTEMRNNNSHLSSIIHSLHNDIQALKDEKAQDQEKIQDYEKKIIRLEKIVCDREHKIGEISLIVDQIVHQRNLLGYQCCKKIEQVHLLTEKNTLMQNLFKMGNRSYNHQSKLINQFKLKITELYHQKKIIMNKLESTENLRSKLGLANQQLVTSLARVTAMEGEHPYNLHHWRHLKAMNVSQYEMIIKIQHLQKRVIMKTDEVSRLEKNIFDKTVVVQEMKKALERRPGPEIIEQARSHQKANDQLCKKLKASVAERNMCTWKCERQVIHNRDILTRLLVEKKKALSLNKANIKLKDKVAALPPINNQFFRGHKV